MENSLPNRILLVEDEPSIGQVCQRILNPEGFLVDIATNGKTAQTLLTSVSYDICLIDIKMASMNGKELYRWMKNTHPNLAGRVIFTTGDVMSADTRDFLEQAGRPCLAKPFYPDELRNIVRETRAAIERSNKPKELTD